jgi:hypothetical protein
MPLILQGADGAWVTIVEGQVITVAALVVAIVR